MPAVQCSEDDSLISSLASMPDEMLPKTASHEVEHYDQEDRFLFTFRAFLG